MAGVRQHGWRAIPAVAQNMAQIRFRIDTVQTAGASFPATSRNLSAEAGIRGKNAYRAMNHPVIGVVTKADLASMNKYLW